MIYLYIFAHFLAQTKTSLRTFRFLLTFMYVWDFSVALKLEIWNDKQHREVGLVLNMLKYVPAALYLDVDKHMY